MVSISGSGFAGLTQGSVFFDSNGNGTYDQGEPNQLVTTSIAGNFNGALLTPPVSPGMYQISAGFPVGTVQASAVFTVIPAPSITLSTSRGTVGSVVGVTGMNFPSSTSRVLAAFFDSNRNGVYDPGEPIDLLTTSAAGTFSATLIVPNVALGAYQIMVDVYQIPQFPTGQPVQASAPFTVS